MINYVREQISVITQNANKRKNEEQKLEDEKKNILSKKATIEDLERVLEKKKQLLQERRHELDKHKKFNKFLEEVVNDSGENKEFDDIEDLQNRFKNLKNENAKLMKRKVQINKEMEEARIREKTTLNNLQNNLYEMQRKMQNLQQQLEQIQEKNSALEQDFENEINKKNKNSKEIGQIINSINNIYGICQNHQIKKTRVKPDANNPSKGPTVNEKTPDLIGVLINQLETAKEVIEDLFNVFSIVDYNYDRDKAYTEGLFNNTKAGQPDNKLGQGTVNGGIKPSNAKVTNGQKEGGATGTLGNSQNINNNNAGGQEGATAKAKKTGGGQIGQGENGNQKIKQGSSGGANKEESLAKSQHSQQQ